ncbi:MAG TPA: acyl-CoA dehydrogenase family protein [Candidatus Dormibacteraeota bacterium]|jgi:alkylation response protein AidB-like acyl-CoA dehydrogenase|nr:acyl-CoA dehydrogenase family protein [Candidatus Dormibacteraeota bacterium]
MDFDDTPEEAAWRARVRDFLTSHRDQIASGYDRYVDTDEKLNARKAWQRILHEAGFVGVTWPREYGGQGGSPMQQAIVTQELGRVGSATLINGIGLGMAGPTIIAHGTEEQKQRYLLPLLRADEVWCQLFSEPGAGSDLAALTTRATPDGEGWRIRGQKVWTSGAHYAHFGILVARTDASLPKHGGLSYFILDMHAPGVTVRPLRQMSGDSAFNEVFFDDAPVPRENLLGELNGGWRVAITTLMNERMAIGGGGGDLGIGIEELLRHAAPRLAAMEPARRALLRQELGQCYVEALAARLTGYRRLTQLSRGGIPGPEAAAGKLTGVALARRIADVGVRLLGDDAVFGADPAGETRWQYLMASMPGLAIAGGTNEILKNIIGERVLGLPSEPRPDKGIPFSPDVARTAQPAEVGS